MLASIGDINGIDMEAAETQIRTYVLDNFLFTGDPTMLASDDSFLEKGILDSTGILEMIHYIEEAFGIEIDDEEMIPENLDSVNNIVAFVRQKKRSGAPPKAITR